jgi:glycosyltransferase involved in cell wall biosynthesis
MKIAYFTQSVIPSADADSVQSMNMCYALAEIGHQVTLYAPDREPEMVPESEWFEYYGLDPLFQIRKSPFRLVGQRSYWYAVQAVRTALREQPDLVFSRSALEASFSALVGVPTLFEAHTPVGGQVVSRLFGLACRRRSLCRIVAISESLVRHFAAKIPDGACRVVLGRDAARIVDEVNDIPVLNTRSGCLNIGYTGALFPDKGPDLVMTLADKFDDVCFHVAGGSSGEIEYWKGQCSHSNVFFYGRLKPSAMPGFLQQMDIVVAPYKSGAPVRKGYHSIVEWMSPMKLFEYMAAGRAIICSDLSVLREFMRDGENALLCPPGDFPAWESAVRALLADETLRGRLGRQARQEVAEKYTWKRRAVQVLQGLDF